MKAFVKIKNGHFPGVDYFAAWHGLDELGYESVKFEEHERDTLEVTPETPVVADLRTCRTLIQKRFGWDYNGVNPYPAELREFLLREVARTRWRDIKSAVMKGKVDRFIKPIREKQFDGGVATSVRHSLRSARLQDEDEVYVGEPVTFGAEFRVYVLDDEIVGVKHYCGSWYMHPCQQTVETMIQKYKPAAPAAYGLDVGLLEFQGEWRTSLVEINDGICLGNYGLEAKPYAQMIAARWQELIEQGSAQSAPGAR